MIDLRFLADLVLDLKFEESKEDANEKKCKELEEEILTYLKSNI